MQRKTISLVLCLTLLVSMIAFAVPSASAATVDSASAGYSRIESADDFSWDNVNMYFLLTDRFYNGNTSNDHAYGRACDANGNPISGWQTSPGTFHGGDFAGLTQKINEGYFDDMGVNALWISAPYEQIHGYVTPGDPNDFSHYSYHGYYTLDYTETDANFGTKAEFKTMVDAAHAHGIRVVMDVVMNHAGYNTIKDMLEYNFGSFKDQAAATSYLYKLTGVNDLHSTVDYKNSEESWGRWWSNDWIRSGLPGYEEGSGEVTGCVAGLPDFRTESTKQVSIPPILRTKWQKEGTYNQKVAKYGSSGTVSDYLTTWLAEWVETYGVDGFRCDTAKHVELGSWKKLKNKCVAALRTWRQNNPTADGADWDEDFWMTGECWGYKSGYGSYYSDGGFDSMISFSITGNVSANPCGLGGPESIDGMYSSYAADINTNPDYNLLSYLSSHDTGLVRQNSYWQGTAFQLLPGGIQIFYGDETARPLLTNVPVGGDGHAVRSDMNWGQNADLRTHWAKVGKFRANHVAVGAGAHQLISSYSSSTGYTFARTYLDDNVTDGVICCIGAPVNQQIAVDVSSMWGNGKTVTNEYDGTTAVVTNGKATFNSGAQGVILISGPQSTIAMSLTGKPAFYDQEEVSLKLRGADYAMVSVDGGTPFRVTDGQVFSIGNDIAVGTVFEVVVTATNATETVEKTFKFKKKDPDAVTRIYFDNSSYNWSKVNAYVYDDSGAEVVENGAWPGSEMTYDSEKGLYVYEVDEDLADTGAVVFNNGTDQYPPKGVRLDIKGSDKILIQKTVWKEYEGEIVQPTDPPAPGTQRTIYLDAGKFNAGSPKCYVWIKGTKTDLDPWPGTTMVAAPEMGANFYKLTCDAKYNCCIFTNNGGGLCGDQDIPYLKAMYDGTWHELKDSDPTDPTNPTNPTGPISGRRILIGDSDLNDRVDIKDVTAIQRHLADLGTLTGDALIAADVDVSKNVTILDGTLIQMYLVEIDRDDNHTGELVYVEDPTDPTEPTEPTNPTQPAGQRTIYLDGAKFGTTTPYVYVWKKGQTENMGAFPGKPMTAVGNGIYSYTCPEEYNCCIFSKDGGDKSKISGDLDIPYTSALYNGSWSQYSGSNDPTTPTTPPDPANSVTLVNGSFVDPQKGQDWYAWTWNNNSDGRWISGTGDANAYVFTGEFGAKILFVRVPVGEDPSWNPSNIYNQTPDLDTKIGGTYVIDHWYGGNWQ